jgi:hypothetical protein
LANKQVKPRAFSLCDKLGNEQKVQKHCQVILADHLNNSWRDVLIVSQQNLRHILAGVICYGSS